MTGLPRNVGRKAGTDAPAVPGFRARLAARASAARRGSRIASLPTAADASGRGPWLRSIAAVTSLLAGAIHIGQVGLHLDQDWTFAAFFLTTGMVQLTAAVLLLRPRPAAWSWFGIVGSLAVIATWLLSRSLGLPFGAEPGTAEEIGMADAAASAAEAITIVALGLWLTDARGRSTWHYGAAIASVALLTVAWLSARSVGAFDPDPRVTGGPPDLADRALVPWAVSLALMFALLWREDWHARWHAWRPLMRGLGIVFVLTSATLVVVTLPARGGQNAACAYGPLADVGALSHDVVPEPVVVAAGAEITMPLVLLSACGADAVTLADVEELNARGSGARVMEYLLLPAGQRLPDEGFAGPLPGTSPVGGTTLTPGEPRELAVRLNGTGSGTFSLDSVRVTFRSAGSAGAFGFATYLSVCAPGTCR